MGRSTLGNPRVKETKGARQARLLRALEHRVRRLEKQAWPAVTYEAAPLSEHQVELLSGALELRAGYDALPAVNVHDLIGEQVLLPLHGTSPLFDAGNVAPRRREVTERVLDGHLRFHYCPELDPWPWRAARALHRFFVNLRRPSRGARFALSDDTQ